MRILVIQNKMGIGDMVIYLPFIKSISKKFSCPITLLVKESTKADQYLNRASYIDEIIYLKRNNNKNDKHDGFVGSIKLSIELKNKRFDKVFILNSSLRFYLICKLANIKEIFQYPLFKKKNQHIINAAKDLIRNTLNLEVESNPNIEILDEEIINAKKKFNINKDKINILLGIGGSGPTKRTPPEKFIKFMELCLKKYDCRFYLATGGVDEEQKILLEIVNHHQKSCLALDKLKISEILPIIKNCDIAICNDSSFSHLSAALGKKTIVLMCDTPKIYGSYNSNMHPILPDGVENVTHGTEGKDKINPLKIFEKFQSLIS